ncbi:MAG: CHAD domain-containing protein [Thermoguttaceae bacterium]|jgi:CHAD domain-containing protein
MAKQLDRSYPFLAAQYVRRQVKQLVEQFDGVRAAEDIEFIHRARVASRRLRAALKMFSDCFDAKALKRWQKQIRRITEGLGDARDKDVQIEFLCSVLSVASDKSCFPGIARLLVQLEHERDLLQPIVVKAADRLAASKVLDEMQAVTKGVLAESKAVDGKVSDAKGQDASVYGEFARAETRQHILRRLEEMLPYEDSLQNPSDCQRHHAMRIAAKRLRYTVEIARPVYGAALDEIITAVKRVQTLLGDIHDCDVWVEHLAMYAAAERRQAIAYFGHAGRFARLEPGIEYLRQERRGHRQQIFQQLVDYWQQLRGQGFWDNLVRLVQSPWPAAAAASGVPSTVVSAAGDALPLVESVAEPVPVASSVPRLRCDPPNGNLPKANGSDVPAREAAVQSPRPAVLQSSIPHKPVTAALPSARREPETIGR